MTNTVSSTPTATLADPATDRTEPPRGVSGPDQIHQAFTEATNGNDIERLMAIYHPDGVSIDLDGLEHTGAANLRAMFEGLAGAISHIEGSTRKVIVAGDLALTSGDWTAQIELPDGTRLTQRGRTAEVSRRQPDGSWRVMIDDPLF